MKIDAFRSCPLQTFARLIEDQLDVQVKMKGRQIQVEYSNPPVIYLPILEQAKDDDIRVLYGFCAHEAAHLRYTDPQILEEMPNYVLKIIHNAIEDDFVERMLERDFPGARELLEHSYRNGHDIILANQPLLLPVRDKSFLTERGGLAAVVEIMEQVGLDTNDEVLVEEVAKRKEIERVCALWFYSKRGYDFLPTHDWNDHPWKPIFDEITEHSARSSLDALAQAQRIYDRLDLRELFVEDARPVEDARKAVDAANLAIEARNEAADELRQAVKQRDEEIKQAQSDCFENALLQEKKDERIDAERESKEASAKLRLHRERLHKAQESARKTNERLVNRKKRLRDLMKNLVALRADSAPQTEIEIAELAVETCKFNIDVAEDLLVRREKRIEELTEQDTVLLDESLAKKQVTTDKILAEAEAQTSYDDAATKIKGEFESKWMPTITPLESHAEKKREEAESAEEAAREILGRMQARDAQVEAPFAPGALEGIIGNSFDKFKDETVESEVGTEVNTDMFSGEPRKYVPYTRELDVVQHVEGTAESKEAYDEAVWEYRKVIQKTTDVLRRLYSPVKSKIRTNVEEGRLDPRQAYKVGLALNGAPVDISRVWRRIVTRKDPKVAVEIVLDCSGSMNKRSEGKDAQTYMNLARKAATALSEVCQALFIPHEIVGHTTQTDGVKKMPIGTVENDDGSLTITVDGEEAGIRREKVTTPTGAFSRYVPFLGYVFKDFTDNGKATGLYTKFKQEDNFDGEAIRWAAQRLQTRPEKTKILVVICDALPDATLSNPAELERHLLTVAKQVESKEDNGMFLVALGMDSKVKEFFKNYEVLEGIESLPKAMLGVVEKILVELVGSLG